MDVFTAEALLNLLTLTSLEIILGIDNVIFIALLVQHLKGSVRTQTRIVGLSLALLFRILMLFGATWIMTLTTPLFSIFKFPISGRDLLLIIGGLFLVVKSIMELSEMVHNRHDEETAKHKDESKFIKIISQIIFIDIILSFDSIITAVGISNEFPIMVIAVVIAMITMLISSNSIGEFIYANPSIKVIALAFIALLGALLVLHGLHIDMNKSYLYFSMAFAIVIELINIRLRKKH